MTGKTRAAVKNPQDRAAAIKPMLEKMGGKLHGFWLAFAEYDFVVIAEMPDAVSAAAMSMAIGATGAMSSYRTTLLLSVSEATDAMRRRAVWGIRRRSNGVRPGPRAVSFSVFLNGAYQVPAVRPTRREQFGL
jgi:uncharacterized protein with GYD domain